MTFGLAAISSDYLINTGLQIINIYDPQFKEFKFAPKPLGERLVSFILAQEGLKFFGPLYLIAAPLLLRFYLTTFR